MQPIETKQQNIYNKANSRVHHLYRTRYRAEVKSEGYVGQAVYKEGMRRAKKQAKEENKQVQQKHTRAAQPFPSDVGSNKELLAILPKKC